MLPKLMKEEEVAGILGVSPKTLQGWRWRGTGPAYVKVGRSVRYRQEDVEAFLRPCTSTTQDTEEVDS